LLELLVSECPGRHRWQVVYLTLRGLMHVDGGRARFPPTAELARAAGTSRSAVGDALKGLHVGRGDGSSPPGLLFLDENILDRPEVRTEKKHAFHARYSVEMLTGVQERISRAHKHPVPGKAGREEWNTLGADRGNKGKKGRWVYPATVTFVFLLTFAVDGKIRADDAFFQNFTRQRGIDRRAAYRHFAALERSKLLEQRVENGCSIYVLRTPKPKGPAKTGTSRKYHLDVPERKDEQPAVEEKPEPRTPEPEATEAAVDKPQEDAIERGDSDLEKMSFHELEQLRRFHSARRTPEDDERAKELAAVLIRRVEAVTKLSDAEPHLLEGDWRRMLADLGELDQEAGSTRADIRKALDCYAGPDEAKQDLGRELQPDELSFFTKRKGVLEGLRSSLPYGMLEKPKKAKAERKSSGPAFAFPLADERQNWWKRQILRIYKEVFEDRFPGSRANITSGPNIGNAGKLVELLRGCHWPLYDEGGEDEKKVITRLRAMIGGCGDAAKAAGKSFGLGWTTNKRFETLRRKAEEKYP